jgi:tetratricopeptide (TPR) repeat protein
MSKLLITLLIVIVLLVACQSPVLEPTPSVVDAPPPRDEVATPDAGISVVEAASPNAGPSVVEAESPDAGSSGVEAPSLDAGPSVIESGSPDVGQSVVEPAFPDAGQSIAEATPLETKPSVLKAKMLVGHGLRNDAQRELIEVLFSDAEAAEKASALDLLATIAVGQNNFKAALDSWTRLIDEYPTSAEAIKAKERLPLLASMIGEFADELVDDATALIYLRSADFWSKKRDRKFTIDVSWIPKVEAAIHWYDKVIAELPNSSAARLAYEDKMRTILGWEDPGQYGDSWGVLKDPSYLPILIATFRDYEAAFPSASRAQGFRYLIAQAFWIQKDWAETRNWLNEIIAKDGGANSFYKDLAERRLNKVEY